METKIADELGNPFPGLRPFRADEGHLFFGRESQVDIMVDKLATTRLLGVVGTSGSGKSSLVNCGLRPALHRGLMADAGIRWRMVQFRPGNNPLRAMARALAEDDAVRSNFDFDPASLQVLVETSLRISNLGLSEVYKRAQLTGTNLLIVVDQFEELFRYREIDSPAVGDVQLRSQEATAFVNLLLDAKTQTTFPIYVVLTMRSDFLGRCAEFPGLPEAINEGQYLVPRLTRDERRAAMAGPAGVCGARVSPVLLTRLVNDAGDNTDQLSILQHALNRTWAKWRHEGKQEGALELSQYEAIGTMAHALDQHAEKAYGELGGPRQQKICEKIFKALTDKRTDPGIRRPTKFARLCELAGAAPEEVAAVIDIFRKPSRSFLMPPLPEALEADTVVDISHESLMRLWERLKQWTEEEVQSAQLYRRLSETAALHAAGKAGLWDDPDLQFALDWKNKEQPTECWGEFYGGGFAQAMSFLAESQKQRDRELQEKEELGQRDLQQAQALAAERQERIEQQAQAARRLRGWLAALAAVTAIALLVSIYAYHEGNKASRAEVKATRALAQANSQKKEAEDRGHEADMRKREAQEATWKAEEAKRDAKEAENEMRTEALRVRSVNLEYMSNYSNMVDFVLQNDSSQQAAMWRGSKGTALLELGDYQDAEPLLTQALKVAPDDVSARTSRGYLFLLRHQPREALKDFQYIRDNIDHGSALNYLNLTIGEAEVGDYPAAKASLQKAIVNTESKDFDGGNEAVVSPDITQATGRTKLQADKATFEAALYYMQANLEAYVGNANTKDGFEDKLALADRKVKPLSPVSQREAYFIAMTWAWLQLGFRCSDTATHCKDYGALASEAALWERAGEAYKPWAACYYQKFQDQDAHWHDPRYASLAQLVKEKREKLNVLTSSCPQAPERDPLTLETEAREASAGKNFQAASKLFDQAWKKAAEPDKMRLLLGKAEALYQMGRAAREKGRKQEGEVAFLELKRHCDWILKQNPREAKAYYYRALAQAWLSGFSPLSKKIILADVRQALVFNPTDLESLSLLDNLAPDNQPGEDIAYLKQYRPLLARYYRMAPYTSKAFLHQAKLAQDDKQYKQALTFIETAIAMDPDNLSLYDVRHEIELAAGIPPADVEQDLLLGHVQAMFVVKRRGNPEDAELLSTINKKIDTELAQNRPKQ